MGGQPDPTRKFFRDTFPTLTGTDKEARELKKLAEARGIKVNLHEGKEASKSRLMDVHRPFILHLATHGYFFGKIFTGTNSGPMNSTTGADNRPNSAGSLLDSGLALAGANQSMAAWMRGEGTDPEQSGLASAAELAGLDLNTTWLATLSACDTGVGGVVDGEDMLALRRAMLQAGARNVLSTLWRVNDAYTSDFMQDFYATARVSGDAGGALAEAQRRALCQPGKVSMCDRVRLAGPFVLTSVGRPDSVSR